MMLVSEAAKVANSDLVRYLLKHGALDYDNKALAVVIEVWKGIPQDN